MTVTQGREVSLPAEAWTQPFLRLHSVSLRCNLYTIAPPTPLCKSQFTTFSAFPELCNRHVQPPPCVIPHSVRSIDTCVCLSTPQLVDTGCFHVLATHVCVHMFLFLGRFRECNSGLYGEFVFNF